MKVICFITFLSVMSYFTTIESELEDFNWNFLSVCVGAHLSCIESRLVDTKGKKKVNSWTCQWFSKFDFPPQSVCYYLLSKPSNSCCMHSVQVLQLYLLEETE